MFKFEVTYILYFLALLPLGLVILWFSLKWRERLLEKAGEASVLGRLFPEWSRKKEWLKSGLILASLAFLIIAWANPQWGTRTEKVKVKSSDIVIALDISQSMLADDVLPTRIEVAKKFVSELIKRIKGDRISLIFFAGSAYLQMPLTTDYAAAQQHVKSAHPRLAGTQGTLLSEALNFSSSIFQEETQSQRALVIISDGENHETEAIEIARDIKENGITTFTLGIGTREGAYVPVDVNSRQNIKKDKQGNPIVSSLNAEILQDVATAGGGQFYMIDNTLSALGDLVDKIKRLEKKEVETKSFSNYNSYFQYFLFIAILLIFIEYLMSNNSSKSGNWRKKLGV